MTRPPHIADATRRLRGWTGIQHGQLGADLNTLLGWLDQVEHDDTQLRAEADTVTHARQQLGALTSRLLRQLDGGPGDRLDAELPSPARRTP